MDFASEDLRTLAGKVNNVTGTQQHPMALYLAFLMAGLGRAPKCVGVREDHLDDQTVEWAIWAVDDTTLFAGRCQMVNGGAKNVEVASMRFEEIVGVRVADVELQDTFSSSEKVACGSWTFRDRSGATISVLGEPGNRLRNELVEEVVAAVLAEI